MSDHLIAFRALYKSIGSSVLHKNVRDFDEKKIETTNAIDRVMEVDPHLTKTNGPNKRCRRISRSLGSLWCCYGFPPHFIITRIPSISSVRSCARMQNWIFIKDMRWNIFDFFAYFPLCTNIMCQLRTVHEASENGFICGCTPSWMNKRQKIIISVDFSEVGNVGDPVWLILRSPIHNEN